MNRYNVIIDFRPHVNSMERRTKTVTLTAPNKEVAIFLGGFQFGLDRQAMMRDDIKISVRRI